MITTVEELEAVTEGDHVTVVSQMHGQREWTRTKGGFEWEGTEVPVLFFSPHVVNKEVHLSKTMLPQVGDLFTRRYQWLLVVDVDEHHIWYVYFNRAQFQRIVQYTHTELDRRTWPKTNERPDWYDMALAMGQAMRAAERKVEGLDDQVHSLMAEVTRLAAESRVTVKVTGTKELDPTVLRYWMRENHHHGTEITKTRVDWSVSLTFEGEGPVTEEWVRAQFPHEDKGSDLSWEVECGHR